MRLSPAPSAKANGRPHLPVLELGALLSGQMRLGRRADDITVFDMTGIALQDLTVARSLYQRALRDGLGVSLAWPW
ncbi:MAG: Delta(1)-pyrroline-2-carboxylate reductase [Paracidovorax wautersii]|uniref:Delta(1)-pyrroline-2-carboxylate reductase n=1 Tax=Paracidovorax wautersii TaxID=1177982 RepID=A0A7V8JQM0_9BURK|nr:MAG: Delta(1)-pyrroline-2-carboxylate reductase [Paracidovorax wautersii]